jgi:multidrug transporter EmrE-like cation transporter
MNQKFPILLNCVAAILGAIGQYCYKKGATKTELWFLNSWTFGGIAAFCVVMALFSISYKMGGRISVVYPFYATTFLWGTLLGVLVEREPWQPIYVLGLGLILSGVTVIAWASGKV